MIEHNENWENTEIFTKREIAAEHPAAYEMI